MEKYDVVIVGAATAGAYFAKKMAKKGYTVKMIERCTPEKLGTRMDIFHVSHTDLKTYDIPTVKEGDPEWAFEFTENHFSSPSNNYLVHSTAETVGLHMHEYIALMVKLALEAGAEIEYSASFKEFIFEKNKIAGIRYEKDGKTEELYARTVVDCSGSTAVCRRALPKNYGIETFELTDEDKFYVILRYVKFKNEEINTFWLDTKSWYAPFSMNKYEKIIGTGSTGSFKQCEEACNKLDSKTSKGDFELLRTEKGTTPYRRPPYSLVADNFIVTGDAACLTKPDCGEGVTSAMVMMDIAADVLDRGLKGNNTSRNALWKINTEYNRVQGADFCVVRAFLTKVVKATDEEIEFCFKNHLIFDEKFLDNGKIGVKDVLDVVSGITSGVAKKNISKETICGVISGAVSGLALRQHYLNFPENPYQFKEWCKKADALWEKVGKIS